MSRKELKPIANIRARDGDFEGPEVAEQDTEIAERLQRSRSRPTGGSIANLRPHLGIQWQPLTSSVHGVSQLFRLFSETVFPDKVLTMTKSKANIIKVRSKQMDIRNSSMKTGEILVTYLPTTNFS
ncbi:hypothetical protein YC2023_039177 [Brassica napus]